MAQTQYPDTSFRRMVGTYCNKSTEPKEKDERGEISKANFSFLVERSLGGGE